MNLVVGSCVHKYIELYNLGEQPDTMKDWINDYLNIARHDYLKNLKEDIEPVEWKKGRRFYKAKAAINNFLHLSIEEADEAEYDFSVYIDWADIPLMGSIDAVYGDRIVDYKTVRGFTNLDSWFGWKKVNKYRWQWLFYYYAYYLDTSERKDCVQFLEIKKTNPRKSNRCRFVTFYYNDDDIELLKQEFLKSVEYVKALKPDELMRNFDHWSPSYELQEV